MIEIIIGFMAGIFTSLGMGGGALLISLLSSFCHINHKIAQSTNLLFFIPTSLLAVIINIKNKNIDFKIVVIISFFGIIGAVLGTMCIQIININTLKKIFALFLLIIAIFEIFNFIKQYKFDKKRDNKNKNI